MWRDVFPLDDPLMYDSMFDFASDDDCSIYMWD